MKRMIILSVLLLIFISSTISFAQPHLANTSPILDVPQGFILESLCSYGYNSTTINTISNISNTNPANMFVYNRISFGISYQVESKIKESWYADIDHYRKNLALPQSFSLILPLNQIRIGLGFSQKYNSEKDFGAFAITIVDTSKPAVYLDIGTVKFFKTCLLFDYSLSFAHTFKNFITDHDTLDLGVKISLYRLLNEFNYKVLNMLPEYQKNDYSINDKYSDSELGFALGIKYQFKKLQIGMAFEKGTNFNKKGKDFYLIGKYPDEWSVGILSKLSNQIKIACGLNFLVWNNPNVDGIKNQIEPYGSIIYQFTEKAAFSTGVFHTNYRSRDWSGFWVDRFNAWYFTAGFLYSLKFVDVDLALADSHLFSGEWRKQTIFKIGLGYRM